MLLLHVDRVMVQTGEKGKSSQIHVYGAEFGCKSWDSCETGDTINQVDPHNQKSEALGWTEGGKDSWRQLLVHMREEARTGRGRHQTVARTRRTQGGALQRLDRAPSAQMPHPFQYRGGSGTSHGDKEE